MATGDRKNRLEEALPRLSDYMKKWAQEMPDHEAFIYHDVPLSYREFSDNAHQLAKYFLKIGVQKGDRLGYVMNCRPEFFTFYLAASLTGAVIVGMNIMHTPPEMAYILNNCEASHVLALHSLLTVNYQDRLREALKECPLVGQVWVVGGPAELPNALTWDEIMKGDYSEYDQALKEREAQVETDDGLIIVHTSGTTGRPKGAVLTHRGIISMALVQNTEFLAPTGVQSSDILLHGAPVNHVSGATEWGAAPIIAGATQVPMDYYDAVLAQELVIKYNSPILAGVPAIWAVLLADPETYKDVDYSMVRCCLVGGSMANLNIVRKMQEVITPYVVNAYGMTETSGCVTFTETLGSAEVIGLTVGKCPPEWEMKVADREGTELPRGTVGEVCFRGPLLFKEYYRMPEATAAAFDKDEFFHSGDLGYVDENGNLRLVGRSNDMYITNGYNVYPAELEEAISGYPGVLHVAVVPVPHDIAGEVGRAYIVPKPGFTLDGDAIQSYLKDRLARYKIPRQYVFRDSLPMGTTLNKIEKKTLREEIEKELAK